MSKSQGDPSDLDSSARCPSCGRYVGVWSACPYCGARVSGRLRLQLVRYGAVVIALLGLGLLWVAARSAELPTLLVGDIGRTMNWAYVKMGGTVTRYPSYDDQSGYLRFWMDDGTGEIMVVAYRDESQALMREGMVPAIGDRVVVEGTLKVKEDLYSLTIHAPERVALDRPVPEACSINEIGVDDVHRKVIVQGQVREVRVPYNGLTVVSVRDRTGQIDVVYNTDLVRLGGEPIGAVPGDFVEARGAVTLYGGGPQVYLDSSQSLAYLPSTGAIAPWSSVADVGLDDVGRMVRLKGTVSQVLQSGSAQKCLLDDGTGRIGVVLWNRLLDGIPDHADLVDGTQLDVQGMVSAYRGEIELVPELALDVQFTAPERMPVQRLALSEITIDHEGEEVSVDAQIVRVIPFSSGARFTLQQGDTDMLLVVWQELLDACPDRYHLVPGAWVSVQGKVETYQGQLEIVPNRADGVAFVEMREVPSFEQRRIADLAESDVGQSCQLEGQIVVSTAFSKGIRWVLEDGTGTIAVLLWQHVVDGLTDPTSLVVGARVRVSGEVSTYKQTLEVVPSMPGDVVWLEAPPTRTPAPSATPLPAASPTLVPTPTAAPTHTPVPTPTPEQHRVSTGTVTEDLMGRQVMIEGRITEITLFDSGARCYVDDGTGATAVWLLQELFSQLYHADEWIVGSTLRVIGAVEAYKGEIELVPDQASRVKIIAVATPEPPFISRIAELRAEHVGQRVTVEGTVIEVETFSGGTKYLVDDGSGRMTLVLWQNVLETMVCSTGPGVGMSVRATGRLDEYRGELEVVPGIGSDMAFGCSQP